MIRRLFLVVLPLALAACSSDEPKKPSATPVVDAGVVIADAGPVAAPVVDAGPPPVVDAGPPPASAAATGAATGSATPASSDAPRGTKSVFDRVLAKPKEPGASHDAIKKKIEDTGLKVLSVKKSARTWVLIELAPTSPARTAAQQQEAIAALRGTGLFSAIEGDRLMQVK